MGSAMSLGRLLRRASSKASDLLTLTTGGSGGSLSVLDGEVIYSKNNVCVHAPEGLQGPGEHHPGEAGGEGWMRGRVEGVEGVLGMLSQGGEARGLRDLVIFLRIHPFCLPFPGLQLSRNGGLAGRPKRETY